MNNEAFAVLESKRMIRILAGAIPINGGLLKGTLTDHMIFLWS